MKVFVYRRPKIDDFYAFFLGEKNMIRLLFISNVYLYLKLKIREIFILKS